jgi:hypothetical protein
MPIEGYDKDRQCTPTPNRIDVSGTGMTLPDRVDVSEAAAGPCQLQLCAVYGPFSTSLFVAPQIGARLKRTIFHERNCGATNRSAAEANNFPRAYLWCHK